MNFGFVQTGRGVNLFFGARPVPVDNTHLYYNEILEELKKGAANWSVERLQELSNVPEKIKGLLYGDVTVTPEGEIYYKNRPVRNSLTEKMFQVISEGWDVGIWANFLDNVMKNPSQVAIDELYLFLEKAEMPLTPDGHFLAFKKVRNDYTSIHDGKTDNSIGSRPSMPRENVDPNRHNTCSRGLHFCAHDYLRNFGDTTNSRVVILKINPADVVAIPSDYNNAKGRAWTYEVVGEIDNPGTGARDSRFNVAVDDSWDYQGEDAAELAPGAVVVAKEVNVNIVNNSPADVAVSIKAAIDKAMTQKVLRPAENEELLFGDVYTAKELLDHVATYGSIRAAGRALGIAKSTFGDWIKKAKEIESAKTEAINPEAFEILKQAFIDIIDWELAESELSENLDEYFGIDELDLIEIILAIDEDHGIDLDKLDVTDYTLTAKDILVLITEELNNNGLEA